MPRFGKLGRWHLSVVVITLILAFAGALFFGRSLLAPGLVKQGIATYDRGDWTTAAALAQARLKTVPDDKQALRLLARSFARQRRDKLARTLYSQVGGIAAIEAEDFYLLGTIIDRLGDRAAAQECWEDCVRADPNHAEALHELARLHLSMGRYKKAAELANRLAARRDWQAQGNMLLGQIKFAQDDVAGAAECLRQALAINPAAHGASEPLVTSRKLLAKALLRSGQPAGALNQLQMALNSGSDSEVSWLLSRAYLQLGSVNQASIALEKSNSYREEHPLTPEPASYVGSARCAPCHASIHRSEQTSLHARTFKRSTELKDLILPDHPIRDPAQAGVSHTIERTDGQILFKTDQNGQLYQAVVDYAFGAGGQRNLTLVGRDDSGRFRELRFSYYGDGSGWDVTSGHDSYVPAGEDYLGKALSEGAVYDCFYCHTTVARSARDCTGPESADRGIGCERCHGPGGNHLTAVALKFPDLAILQPGRGTGQQVIGLCGQCHSPLGKEVGRSDPLAVRFPATNLTWSKCYTESAGNLNCLTCHNPHRDAEKGAAFYEAKCLSCHSSSAAGTSQRAGTADRGRATVCTVSPSGGCIPCHMPVVKTGIPHTSFTDHNIRIHSRSELSLGSAH